MKKFLLSLATLALAATSAMAAPAEIFTVTFGSAGNVSAPNIGAYDKTQTYTGKEGTVIADKTWTVTNFNNYNNGWSDNIRCGRKKNASTGSVATDFAFAENITSVELSIVVNYENVTSIDLYTSADGKKWSTNPVASDKNITKSTTSVTLTDPNPAPNQYYKIDFVCTAHTSRNGLLSLKSIKYNGEAAISGDQKPADLKFGVIASAVALDQIDTWKAPVLNNPNNLPVTWTSSDENVATVDANGKVTIKAEGSTTITATSEETTEFAAGRAFYTLVVRRAGIIFDNPCTGDDCGFKSEIVNGDYNPWIIDSQYGLVGTGAVGSTEKHVSDAIMYRTFKIPEGNIAVLNFQQALNYFGEYTAENVNKQISVVAGKVVDGVVSSYEKVGEINLDPNQTKWSWTFFSNNEIKLPASLSGEIFIGFRYTSNESVAGTWEIKNVMVNYEPAPVVPAEITAIEALSKATTGNVAATYDEDMECWSLTGEVVTEGDNDKDFTIQVTVAEGAELWYYAQTSEAGMEPLAEGEEESDLPPLTQSLDGKITLPAGEGGAMLYTKHYGVLSAPTYLQYYDVTIKQDTSGVETIESENANETVVYDLLGRRMNSTKALKGLYIVNGKKTVLR